MTTRATISSSWASPTNPAAIPARKNGSCGRCAVPAFCKRKEKRETMINRLPFSIGPAVSRHDLAAWRASRPQCCATRRGLRRDARLSSSSDRRQSLRGRLAAGRVPHRGRACCRKIAIATATARCRLCTGQFVSRRTETRWHIVCGDSSAAVSIASVALKPRFHRGSYSDSATASG